MSRMLWEGERRERAMRRISIDLVEYHDLQAEARQLRAGLLATEAARDAALADAKRIRKALSELDRQLDEAREREGRLRQARDAALARVKGLEGMPSATYDPHDPNTWGRLFPPPTRPAPAGTTIDIGFWREGQEENQRLRVALAKAEANVPMRAADRKAVLADVIRAVARAFAGVQECTAMATPSAEWSELLLATLAAIGKVQEGDDV